MRAEEDLKRQAFPFGHSGGGKRVLTGYFSGYWVIFNALKNVTDDYEHTIIPHAEVSEFGIISIKSHSFSLSQITKAHISSETKLQ